VPASASRAGAAAPAEPAAAPPLADAAPVTPPDITAAVNALLREHGPMPLASDVGDCLFTSMDIEHTSLLAPGYYATMGYGVPAGLGLQVATGQRPIVLVGDGAFQMSGMELGTIARYRMNPIIIVLDNAGYGTERPMLDGPFNDIVPWRYERLPEVLGAGHGYDVRTEAELDAALIAARRQRSSVATGVAGRFCSRHAGWNRVKWSGTSGPSSSRTKRERARASASESFWVGMTSVTISVHVPFFFSRRSVSSTGASSPPVCMRM